MCVYKYEELSLRRISFLSTFSVDGQVGTSSAKFAKSNVNKNQISKSESLQLN